MSYVHGRSARKLLWLAVSCGQWSTLGNCTALPVNRWIEITSSIHAAAGDGRTTGLLGPAARAAFMVPRPTVFLVLSCFFFADCSDGLQWTTTDVTSDKWLARSLCGVPRKTPNTRFQEQRHGDVHDDDRWDDLLLALANCRATVAGTRGRYFCTIVSQITSRGKGSILYSRHQCPFACRCRRTNFSARHQSETGVDGPSHCMIVTIGSCWLQFSSVECQAFTWSLQSNSPRLNCHDNSEIAFHRNLSPR